jgi:diguanylate cyclase (GGDEF)-like protein
MHDETPDAGREALEDAVDAAALVGATRSRAHAPVATPDRRSGLLTGGSFAGVVVAWLLLAPPTGASLAAFAACIVAHAIASSIEFEIGPGSALPTTPVLVVALFVLPPQLVPVVAASGLVLAASIARLRDPSRHERLAVLVGSAWHAIGPAAVFAVARVSAPDLALLPVFALAIAAQLACDAAASWVRNSYGLGVPTRQLAEALRFTFAVDVLLAPVGLMAALAAPGSAGGLLFLVPPTALLAMLQRDRERHISRTVVLGVAVSAASDQARLDALTGLRNRLAWEEALASHRASPQPFGVVFADVDGLKLANDVRGHETGDRLLMVVARALQEAAPIEEGVLAARLGGDEFGILLPGDAARGAGAVAASLRAILAAAPAVDGLVPVSASIGVGVAAAGPDLGAALAEADRRLYEDKSRKASRRRGEPMTGL